MCIGGSTPSAVPPPPPPIPVVPPVLGAAGTEDSNATVNTLHNKIGKAKLQIPLSGDGLSGLGIPV